MKNKKEGVFLSGSTPEGRLLFSYFSRSSHVSACILVKCLSHRALTGKHFLKHSLDLFGKTKLDKIRSEDRLVGKDSQKLALVALRIVPDDVRKCCLQIGEQRIITALELLSPVIHTEQIAEPAGDRERDAGQILDLQRIAGRIGLDRLSEADR